MSGRGALILTYHAIEKGPAPLCIDPDLFARHLEVLADAGATTLTVSELAEALEHGTVPERAVAITFDDAFRSVYDHAAPLLADAGRSATIFAVAGALGGQNDWPSQPDTAPLRPLMDAEQLKAVAAAGLEIGSHGVEHAPLVGATQELAQREVVHSQELLSELLSSPVRTFAYPYGAAPSAHADALVRQTYAAAVATRLSATSPGDDLYALPRVDSHYLRRPELLRRAVVGSARGYLMLRRAGAGSRRLARKDYREPAPA